MKKIVLILLIIFTAVTIYASIKDDGSSMRLDFSTSMKTAKGPTAETGDTRVTIGADTRVTIGADTRTIP